MVNVGLCKSVVKFDLRSLSKSAIYFYPNASLPVVLAQGELLLCNIEKKNICMLIILFHFLQYSLAIIFVSIMGKDNSAVNHILDL